MKPFDEAVVEEYTRAGYWDDETLADRIRLHAERRPDGIAFADDRHEITWREYDEQSSRLAAQFVAAGLAPGDFLGVLLPDGPGVHTVYVAAEKAGLTVVGVGPRSRANEIHHMFSVTGCTALLTEAEHRGQPAAELLADLHARGSAVERHLILGRGSFGFDVSVGGRPVSPVATEELNGRALGPNDLALVNSTSGTTGLPKCVMQTQNRWKYFHTLAEEAGELTEDDVFLVVIPAPYGFGLWTAHFTPTLLGAPTIVQRSFDVDSAFELIERYRATVLCCVSTQFVMMLNAPSIDRYDLSSLRVMFTGGERVPTTRSAEWERRTGSLVLQFYGSNESGAASCTKTTDSQERRFETAGRVIDDMNVKLFDPESGAEITEPGARGICAVRGPAMTPGYFADPEANKRLFRPDGWMLAADLCEIDEAGYLTVVGRDSDFVIRGGQNISAQAVEEAIETHIRIGVAGVVAMPDEVLGERACAFVETRDGGELTLDELTAFLDEQGFSKYMWPEKLVVVDRVPRGANGKVDKAELRKLVSGFSVAAVVPKD
jgi:acyl-CoA synthetase